MKRANLYRLKAFELEDDLLISLPEGSEPIGLTQYGHRGSEVWFMCPANESGDPGSAFTNEDETG